MTAIISHNNSDSLDSQADGSRRIARLNTASLKRIIEPEFDVVGEFGSGQLLPDCYLTIADLDLDLTPAQRVALSREELASVFRVGIEFEAVLMSGFAFRLASSPDVSDPRFSYALHEIGEETRHSRLFARAVGQLSPTQRTLISHPAVNAFRSRTLPLLFRRPTTLDAFVLGGEEIPDLLQRLWSEHPDTDPYVKAISRYHRQEEARHLAFARTTIAEHYRTAGPTDRFAVAHIVPQALSDMFDFMVQPYVYEAIGLPAWRTWRQVRNSPSRRRLREQAIGGVLGSLLDAGVFRPGQIPTAWQRVCGVNAEGRLRRDA